MRHVDYRLSLTARCGFGHRKRGPWVRVTSIRRSVVATGNRSSREGCHAKGGIGSPQPGLSLDPGAKLDPIIL